MLSGRTEQGRPESQEEDCEQHTGESFAGSQASDSCGTGTSRWTEHRAPNPLQNPQAAPAPATPVAATQDAPVLPAAQAAPSAPAAPAAATNKRFRCSVHETSHDNKQKLERLRAEMARLGVLDVAELERQRDQLQAEIQAHRARLTTERGELERHLHELQQRVVVTQEEEVLQEVGVYRYRHPLSDSVAYKDALQRLQGQIKAMNRAEGGAIEATTTWQVNGSAARGPQDGPRHLQAHASRLQRRSRQPRPWSEAVQASHRRRPTREGRVHHREARDGNVDPVAGLPPAPSPRARTHRGLPGEAGSREGEGARGEGTAREERKVQQEIQRERERLNKEKQHYLNALAALEAKGDAEGAERLRTQLADVEQALSDVDYRAANIRAGYVYVISNVGALGQKMIKVGMTRRLEPMDRVRELSDASVPFNFDVHALLFSEDAVAVKTQMHQRLADRRVNRVNLRSSSTPPPPRRATS